MVHTCSKKESILRKRSPVFGKRLPNKSTKLAAALVDYGDGGGQVLALADVGMLGAGEEEPANLPFWLNLARYARSR